MAYYWVPLKHGKIRLLTNEKCISQLPNEVAVVVDLPF